MEFSGSKLKKARLLLALSRIRLGELVECSDMSVYNWETGRYSPSANMVAKLADALSMPLEYFYEAM